MNLKELRKLITLFEQRNLSELEYEEAGIRVRLRKEPSSHQSLREPGAESQPQSTPAEVTPPSKELATSPTRHDNVVRLQSPIVGTFFSAPAPDAAPYVELGDVVSKGQVMCIVEAMKVMNEIEAECGGRVASILAENAQPVEYGETLFLIEPLSQAEVAG